MSADHDNCYLCASDEGILLDIFGDAGQTLRENIETCLSVKIRWTDSRCEKICHKCAYELDSCRKFLGKCKRSKDSRIHSVSTEPVERCCLCGEEGEKVRLLEIDGGNSLKYSLRKIGQAFDNDLFKDRIIKRLCVCLTCRYNVDVLSDLKHIYKKRPTTMKNTDKNGLRLLNLPKTRTRVVSRKTTYIPLPKLNGDPDCDSNASVSSSEAPLIRKRGRPRKHKESASPQRTTKASSHFRTCEECQTMVEHGVDMYRYHRNGLTVCKNCWLTMDPEKVSNRRGNRLGRAASDKSTKLCAVFLKDVLTNPAKYGKIYRIERDKHGNATFLITDESSENEDREKKSESVAGLEGASDEKRKRSIKRSPVDSVRTEDAGRSKRARPAMRRSQEPAESPRIVALTRTRNGTQSDSGRSIITRGKRGSSESTTNSESWVNGGGETRPKRSNRGESNLDKTRAIESSIATRSGRTVKSVSPVARLDRRRRGTRGRRRPDSSTSRATPVPGSSAAGSPERSSDESISSSEPPGETFAEKPYTCSVCRVVCVSKLVGKSHELTHEKQPEVKLCRVVVPSLETIDEASPVQEAGEQSRAASDPVESTARTEDNPATETASIDRASTVHPIVSPASLSVEEAGPSVDVRADDDQRRDDEEDRQSRQPANGAEASLVEAAPKSAVAEEGRKEEDVEEEAVQEAEVEANETTRVSEVQEDADETRRDGGEDSIATESLETRDECATTKGESNKSYPKRDESKESPEASQGAEPREPEELGSDERPAEPETEPMIKDSAEENLDKEKTVTGTPADCDPTDDVSVAEPEERPPDEDGPNGNADSLENEKNQIAEDEEPELAPLKFVDEEDEESELAPLMKVAHEEKKEAQSSLSKVEKLAEVEEKEPKLVSPEVTEGAVEEDKETESSLPKMDEESVKAKKHEEPDSISSAIEEKASEEAEPEPASSRVAAKSVEGEEEEEEEEKEAEQEKEKEERQKEEKNEDEEGEREKKEEKGNDEEGREEKEVEKDEKKEEKGQEAEKEKASEGDEENEEKEEKEVEEQRRIVEPKEDEKPSKDAVSREVFDLASAEVKKRLENGERKNDRLACPAETLENISLEIQKSVDMSEVDEESRALGGS